MEIQIVVRTTIVAALCIFVEIVQAGVDYGALIKGDEPELYVEKYGKGESVVVSNGYLFVDFTYVSAPYSVQRVGQAVVVNGLIVNCLYKKEIPEKDERYSQIVKGPDGREIVWRSPAHPSSTLKTTADLYVDMLADWLRENVVVISKTQYQTRQSRPISDEGMAKRLPVIGKTYRGNFPKAISVALSAPTEEQALKAVKTEDKYWRLSDEDTLGLIKNARECPALMERIRAEIATEMQHTVQTNRVPATATQHN